MLEKDFEKQAVDYVKLYKGKAIKQVTSRGFPDRLVLLNLGDSFYFEAKKPVSGKLSLPQIKTIYWLLENGHQVFVGHEIEKFKYFVDTFRGSSKSYIDKKYLPRLKDYKEIYAPSSKMKWEDVLINV